MTPGEYVTTVKIPNSDQNAEEVLVDYFVLIPQEYYEPRILKQDVYAPCLAGQTLPYCRHYSYPDLAAFPKTYGNFNWKTYRHFSYFEKSILKNIIKKEFENIFFSFLFFSLISFFFQKGASGSERPGGSGSPYTIQDIDQSILTELETPAGLATIAKWQPELDFPIDLNKPGKHVLAVAFFTPKVSFKLFSVLIWMWYVNIARYFTCAIIICGLYTFYPLFEVHLCTVTFGLMYG